MRDELYINDVKADLLDNHINLNYASNLLTDVGKIVSNNSYTIKLPKTAGNLYFVECAHIPSSESRFPYLKHAARLVRDGVEMISSANVVLLAVNEYIEIALTWGNVNNFDVLTDKSLKDIAYTKDDFVVWQKGEFSRQFPQVYYGFSDNDSEVWYHPAVSVRWIFDKIAQNAGITFDLPQDRSYEFDEMFIPVLDRNDSDLQSVENSHKLVPYKIGKQPRFNYFSMGFNVSRRGELYFSMKDEYNLVVKNKDIRAKISGHVTFEVDASQNNREPKYIFLFLAEVYLEGYVPCMRINGTVENTGERRYRYTFELNDIEVDLVKNKEYNFIISDSMYLNPENYIFNIVSEGSGSIMIYAQYDHIALGDNYYIVPNLPDMKQIDFVKAVTNMLGLFAVPTSQNSIKFVSFDELQRNISKAPEWTKLILHKREALPNNMEFALDDMARINRFKYKETNEGENDEGIIEINNLTLEAERDAVELPFEATKMKGGIAVIPLYSYDNDNTLKTNNVSPRILRYIENTGTFVDMSWKVLLDKYYVSYRNIVTNAKVITEMVRLNSVELKYLDLTVPVYLAQYGSYFAIISIKTKDDNVCEVKLLKM